MPEIEIIKRLILAAILGGLIGIEREANNRPAGLRTHILVSVGSALIMLISIDGFSAGLGDPARLAAQVVSGIGFLGAGTIMRTGNSIKGLTTAASLWVSAGIGLAMGAGYYLGGIVTSIVTLTTLKTLNSFDRVINKSKLKKIDVFANNKPGILGEIGVVCGEFDVSIKNIIMDEDMFEEEDELVGFSLLVKTPSGLDFDRFYESVYEVSGINKILFKGEEVCKKN